MRTILAIFALASLASAEEPKIANGYKVQIAVQEMEAGKRVNTRSYSMLVSETRRGRLHVGTRVPMQAGNGQFQFYDVGVTLNCQVEETAGQAVLESQVEISTVADQDPKLPAATHQFSTNVMTPMTPGKASPIAEFDDIASKRHFIIEATVTKLK